MDVEVILGVPSLTTVADAEFCEQLLIFDCHLHTCIGKVFSVVSVYLTSHTCTCVLT